MEKQWYPLALLDPKPPNVCGHLSGQPCLFPAQRTRDAGSHVLAIPPGFFPGHSKHSLQSSTPCKAQQLLWKTPLATQFCSLPSSDLSGKSVKECMSPCFEFLRTAMLTGKQHWTAMTTCCDLAATLSRFWSTGVSSLWWKGVTTMILIMLSWSLSYKARFLLLSCCFFWCLHVLFHPDFLQTYQYLSFKSLLNMEKHWWNTDAMFYTEKKRKGSKRTGGQYHEFKSFDIFTSFICNEILVKNTSYRLVWWHTGENKIQIPTTIFTKARTFCWKKLARFDIKELHYRKQRRKLEKETLACNSFRFAKVNNA